MIIWLLHWFANNNTFSTDAFQVHSHSCKTRLPTGRYKIPTQKYWTIVAEWLQHMQFSKFIWKLNYSDLSCVKSKQRNMLISFKIWKHFLFVCLFVCFTWLNFIHHIILLYLAWIDWGINGSARHTGTKLIKLKWLQCR